MENGTSAMEFHMIPFSVSSDVSSILIFMIFFIYLFGVFTNSMIIILIQTSIHLHSPMFFFLCNLSIVDICYTTVTVPKLLYIGISKNNIISYMECFIQIYFYVLVASTENILILIMAFDRYVAICNPLRYHIILKKKNCKFLMTGIWILGSLNSFAITSQAAKITFCHSKIIHQFFCDGKALINIACEGIINFLVVIYIALFIFGFCSVFCILISYIKIIQVILQIKSKEGRKKAFSTCSSHLTVLIMYYSTGASVYMIPKHLNILEQVFSVIYTVVIPMMNPLIYSLRNNDVKKSFHNIVPKKHIFVIFSVD